MADLKSAQLYNAGLSGARLSRPDAGPQEVEGQYSGEFYKGYKSADLGEDLNYHLMQAAKAYNEGNVREGQRLEAVAADIQRQMSLLRPRVQNLTDAGSAGDLIDWAAASAGNIRSSAKPILGGLAGAALGSLVGMPAVGAGIGSTLAGYGTMADEAAGNMMTDKDVRARIASGEIEHGDVVNQARMSGVLQAPLEGLGAAASMLPFVGSAKKVALKELANAVGRKLTAREIAEFEAKELGKEIAEKGVKRYVAEKAALGGAGEFGTEFGQSLVGQASLNDIAANGKDLDFKQAFNEGAAGAVVGGGTGAATALPASLLRDRSRDLPRSADAGGKVGYAARRTVDALDGLLSKLSNPTAQDASFQRMTAPLDSTDPLADANERHLAAEDLAHRIFNAPSPNEKEGEAAARFIQGFQGSEDPATRDALVKQFTKDLQGIDAKRWKTTLFNEGLSGFQESTGRRGNEQSTGAGASDPDSRAQTFGKLTEILRNKYKDVYEAFGTGFSQDPEARTSAEALLNWVRDGMPGNEDTIAVYATQMWGKDAPGIVNDAYDYLATEGLIERNDARLKEVADAFAFHGDRSTGKLEQLRSMIRPTLQDAIGERDLAGLNSFLMQYGQGREVKSEAAVKDKLKQFFGANTDTVLNLYESRPKESTLDKGEQTKNEDGDVEQEAGDWNSGVREEQADVVYHSHGKAPFRLIFDNAAKALTQLKNELVNNGGLVYELGAWSRAKREMKDNPDGLREYEDTLLQKYGEDNNVKSKVSRRAKLKEIDRSVRYLAEHQRKESDKVDLTDADVTAMSDYKAGPEMGRIELTRTVEDKTVLITDPDTGEVKFGTKETPFYVSAGNVIKTMRAKLGEPHGDAYKMLLTGLSSLMATGKFTGMQEIAPNLFDPYTGMTLKDMKSRAEQVSRGGDSAYDKVPFATTVEEKRKALAKLANDEKTSDDLRGRIVTALREGEKAINALYRMLREDTTWSAGEKAKPIAVVEEKSATPRYEATALYNEAGQRVDTMDEVGERGTVVRTQRGFEEKSTVKHLSEGEEMSEQLREDIPTGDRGQGFDRDMLGQAIPERDITPVVGRKQIKFIKDLLTKGVPAFVKAVKGMTEQQRHNLRAATRELLKTGQLDGDLKTRAEAALKALRGVAEKVGAGGTALDSTAASLPKNSVSLNDATNVVTEALKQLGKPPSVHVVPTVAGLPAAAKASITAKGLVFKGQIYVVANTHATALEVENTIWHELLHYGVRAFMNEQQYIDTMLKLFHNDTEIMTHAGEWSKNNFRAKQLRNEGRSEQYIVARGVEEVLANIAGQIHTPGLMFKNYGPKARIMRVIQQGLAKLAKMLKLNGIYVQLNSMSNYEAKQFVFDTLNSLRAGKEAVKDNGLHNTDATWMTLSAETQEAKSSKPSTQSATGPSLTEQQKTEVRDELIKLVGDKIKLSFDKIVGRKKGEEWSGDWVPGAIRISLHALDPLGTGRHEALHQLMKWLKDAKVSGIEDILKNVAMNPLIQRQLARQLQNDPAALKQLSDPEEAAAYLYQFWKAKAITLGPKSETFFQMVQRLLREWRRVLSGEVRDMQRAEQILQAFDAGSFAGNNTQAMADLEAHIQAEKNTFVAALWNGFLKNDALRKVAFTAGDVMRDMKVPALTKLADTLYTPEGSVMKRQSYFDAVPQQRAVWLNKLNNIFKGVDKEDAQLILKHLQGRHSEKSINDPYLREKVVAVRSFLNEMWDYSVERGVKRFNEETGQWEAMGKVKRNYFPRVFDTEKILDDLGGFTQAILDNHKSELARMAKAHNVTPEEIAEAVVKRLVETKDPEINESSSQLGITPFAAAVNKRSMTWLRDEALKDYMSDDIADILTNYTMQMVKRAEYTSRFGNEGEIIQAHLDQTYAHLAFDGDKQRIDAAYDQLDEMERQYYEKKKNGIEWRFPTLRDAVDKLAKPEQITHAIQAMQMPVKAIMAAEGTIGRDITEEFRKISGAVMFYQNLRLLTFSLFSSFIDPLGIVVRGGTLDDAYQAFVRGVKEIVKQIKGDYSTDELQQLAERLGTVDAGSFLDALGQTYSSLYLTGKVKHLNDRLFKWNGMEAWNRAMRIQATQAAIGFIERHLNKPGEHSARYLEELGLSKDTQFDLDNPLVQQAVVRWVNGAILRPNAMQRPILASDPHYALLYHLKQFTYSFHKTILQRAAVEAGHGNLTPAISLVGLYVPMMIAADVIKELLAPGDEPPWMKAGLGSAVSHGVMRANLMGVPQIAVDGFYSPFKEEGVFGTVDRATSVLGPTAEEVFDWLMVPLTEKYSLGETFVRSLPHSPVLSRALL